MGMRSDHVGFHFKHYQTRHFSNDGTRKYRKHLRGKNFLTSATVVCRKPVVPHWDRSGIHLSIYFNVCLFRAESLTFSLLTCPQILS